MNFIKESKESESYSTIIPFWPNQGTPNVPSIFKDLVNSTDLVLGPSNSTAEDTTLQSPCGDLSVFSPSTDRDYGVILTVYILLIPHRLSQYPLENQELPGFPSLSSRGRVCSRRIRVYCVCKVRLFSVSFFSCS